MDKTSQTIDFLLTTQRDERTAKRCLSKAIRRHGVPETITIDGSTANKAAIESYNAEHGTAMAIGQIKYLNNIVEQDHRAVKRVTRPMLGFKTSDAAQGTLTGIELMHMIKKKQMTVEAGDESLTAAELSTPWPRNPSTDRGNGPSTTSSSKICDTTIYTLLQCRQDFVSTVRSLTACCVDQAEPDGIGRRLPRPLLRN
jgi:hypothetical protein